MLIDIVCIIHFLSATYEGKWHDKSLADDNEYRLPSGSKLYQDMGFQGFRVQDVEILQPTKKLRGGELTPEQNEENRRIASIKMRIEHVIGSIKRYRIVKEKMRLWREGVRDMVMETCCALHNFRLRYRPWSYNS